jgi:hypothetical protein
MRAHSGSQCVREYLSSRSASSDAVEWARSHRGATPDGALDAERLEPEQEVLRLARVRVVLDSLELLGEAVATGVGTEDAQAVEEGLEVGQRHR